MNRTSSGTALLRRERTDTEESGKERSRVYCVYCGVKLQDGARECPLCKTPVMIAPAPGTAEKSLYSDRLPEQEKRHGTVLAVWMLTTVMAAACLGCLIFCLRTAGEVSWSGYVLMSAALVWVTLLLPLLFRRYRPMVFLPVDFACLAGFLLYICVKHGENWFLSFAFPVTGIACVLTLLGVVIFRYIRQGRLRLLGLYLVLIGASFMLVEFFQHITFSTPMWVWSLYCVCAFGALGLFLFAATLISTLHAHLRKTFFF